MPSPDVRAKRLRILETLGLLDAAPDPALDRFVRIAARAVNAPMALVTFLGTERQVHKARLGVDVPTLPLADAFCVHALPERGILHVPDALQDPRVACSVVVTGPPNVRSYAGAPIVLEGVLLGTVCVLDCVPGRFGARDVEILRDLGGIASDLLAMRHAERERRLQERRAAECAAAAGEWLWETDARGDLAWLAGRPHDVLRELAGDAVGRPLEDREILDALGRGSRPPERLQALLQRHAPFAGAVVALDDGAARRYLERSGAPFADAAGAFAGYRGSCREVTARVHAERLALEIDAARRASRSKSEFLSRVSHELRTPLNAMLGFTQLMLMDDGAGVPPSPTQRQRLDVMLQAGQRLLALINDMLDLARIEQGGVHVTLEALDVHALVYGAELMLRPLCAERGVRVRSEIAAGACVVRADRRALGQVLLNLLSNAVKYNRAGGDVTVRAQREDGEAVIVVADDGPGLGEAQLAALFQPFNRLGAEGGPVGGSGLGLVISKALVERMDGTLELRSIPGVGTEARVALPAAGAPAAADDPRGTEATSAPAAAAPAARRTVLYVEDDTVNAMLMEQLFTGQPTWRLLVATTGRAAIDLAGVAACDLVLVDMNLPDMTGIEVVAALRARGVQPPAGFVAVSADAFDEQVQRAQASGFTAYWTKPLDLREIMQRLHALLA